MSLEPALRVVQLGFATTVQDHGRAGLGHLGVPTGGAVDRRTHDLMNRLVGNTPGAATIETMGALIVEALRPLVVARSTDASRQTIGAGTRIRVDAPPGAVWAYLAVRGGIAVEAVLGSRSQDTLGGVGPAALVVGASLPIGPDPATTLDADHAPRPEPDDVRVRVWDGPQHDWFVGGVESLVRHPWRVTNDVSRVGVRLEGGALDTSSHAQDQMSSIGLTIGAVQVTPSGEAIVMLANHPTTGGYPVIAVVDPDDLPDLVQCQPGTTVRFRRA